MINIQTYKKDDKNHHDYAIRKWIHYQFIEKGWYLPCKKSTITNNKSTDIMEKQI
jgi:hypothetical protein